MVQLLKKIPKILFPLLLITFVLVICFNNYTFNSFLFGWDSLHPEFNFPLAFERAFNGVFRFEQGVGSVAAHSHMADLPRIITLWFSSFVFPIHFLRYLYIFLCLVLGPLGVYFFINYSLNKEKILLGYLASFLGGLFYLLNLVSLQHFIVIFDMFATQYAFLPWLFLFTVKYLEKGKKLDLLWMLLGVILALPMAYAATLFWAFLGAYLIFLVIYIVGSGVKKQLLKRSIVLLSLVIGVNLFWIIPNIYSGVNQSGIISNSKINTMFSPEAFIRNESYGNPKDILLGRNFLFEWRVFNFNSDSFNDLMEVWSQHLSKPEVTSIGFAGGILVILGLILGLVMGKKLGWGMFFIYIYSLFFLLNTNPPTGNFYSYLNQNFGILKEALRMPFTKFSILFEFASAFFFAFFFFKLFTLIKKVKLGKVLSVFLGALVFWGLVYFTLPAFKGDFISPVVRNDLPKEYVHLFDWFKDNNEGRIARLPMYTLWGWEYHNWGYEGSGFLTYGINNPILDRDYDRWNSGNETFYNQASFALYEENLTSFENVLRKFRVKYLLLDESIINAGGSSEILYTNQIKKLFSESGNIEKVAEFGFLSVYETIWEVEKEIFIPPFYTKVSSDLTYSVWDPIYPLWGDYYEEEGEIDFPFANFDKRGKVEIFKDGENIVFQNGKVTASFPSLGKISEDFSQGRGFPQAYNCDLKKVGEVGKVNDGGKIIYSAVGSGVSCDYFTFENLKYSEGYVLRVKGENKLGRSLKIYLYNSKTHRMDIEELMPQGTFDEYFVIYPKNYEGEGYSLNIETRSFGVVKSENILSGIEIISAPIEWLSTLKSEGEVPEQKVNNLQVRYERRYLPFVYRVDVEGSGLISLNNGFEKGWVAIGKKESLIDTFKNVLEHVRIDSWANGWLVPEKTDQVIIIFWPQLLEFGGLVVGVATLITIFLVKGKKRVKPFSS